MPAYPSTLPHPLVDGFNLAPKKSQRMMTTDADEVRVRKKSKGDRYIGTASFHFNSQEVREEFLTFFETIGEGDLWFSADWFDAIGFLDGEWLFKFLDRSMTETGSRSDFKLGFIMRPVYYTDEYGHVDTHELVETTWPLTLDGEPPLCDEPAGGNVVNDGDNVVNDTINVTVDPTWAIISAAEVAFDWATSTAAKTPNVALPITGNPQWVHTDGKYLYEVGDDYFAGDSYASAPDSVVFGLTTSSMDGELTPQNYQDEVNSYVAWEIDDAPLAEQIAVGRIEFGFVCQVLFRVANTYPRMRVRAEFIDCLGRVLYNAKADVVKASDGQDVWNEVRIESAIPKTTTNIKLWFEFKRLDGSITDFYCIVDNCIMAYRSCD